MADTSKRGFASMDRERQREIASKGGRAAHAKGTAHEFTSDEARNAGRKGGESVSRNREHMAAIGRKGGESRSRNRDQVGSSAFSSTATERSTAIGSNPTPSTTSSSSGSVSGTTTTDRSSNPFDRDSQRS
jgi:general stress protein YciG